MAGVGAMRSLATFIQNDPIQQGAGKKDVYTDFFSAYGNLRKRTGSRSLSNGSFVINSSHEFTCRVSSELEAGLNKAVKVRIDGIIYTIDDWNKIDQKNFYYTFQLNETE